MMLDASKCGAVLLLFSYKRTCGEESKCSLERKVIECEYIGDVRVLDRLLYRSD